MTRLPKIIRLAPKFFYAVGFISLAAGIALPLLELQRWGYSTDLPTQDGFAKSIVMKHVIRQVVDASYIFVNGLVLEVLIAIWDKIGSSPQAEAAE